MITLAKAKNGWTEEEKKEKKSNYKIFTISIAWLRYISHFLVINEYTWLLSCVFWAYTLY